MQNEEILNGIIGGSRTEEVAQPGDERLGPLKELPGVWKNEPGLEGRGWNLIALPFISSNSNVDYRVLVNQYNEELTFNKLQGKVPNRGVIRQTDDNLDQFLVALDYQQSIVQLAADDFPKSADISAGNIYGYSGTLRWTLFSFYKDYLFEAFRLSYIFS